MTGNETETVTAKMTYIRRRHELDWLRSLIVLGLIPVHSAVLFSAASTVPLKNAQTSAMITRIIGFTTAWAMPLLFLVAGASTWFALGSRTPWRYVSERITRLLLPFAFATLLLIPVQVYAIAVATPHLLTTSGIPSVNPEVLDSFVHFYPTYLTGYGYFLTHYSLALVPIFWAHMWFLPRLLLCSVITLPLLAVFRGRVGERLRDLLADVARHRGGVVALGCPIVLTDCLLRSGWLNTLTAHWPLCDDWDQFFVYLMFFLCGYLLYADRRLSQAVRRDWREILAVGSMLWIVAQVISPPNFQAAFTTQIAPYLFLPFRSLESWMLALGLLGFAMVCLSQSSRLGDYLNDAAFPIYVLHMPVIILVGVRVVTWDVELPQKLFVITAVSAIVVLTLYHLCIRPFPPLRLAFGLKAHHDSPSPIAVAETAALTTLAINVGRLRRRTRPNLISGYK